jgi:hypothetical protein
MMRIVYYLLLFFTITCILSSCEFKCSVGSTDEIKKGETKGPIVKNGAALYNGIQLISNKIKINKAYLVFENGDRVPADNLVDFTTPIKMIVIIDSGWIEQNNKVHLGISEKITAENGKILMDEADLFKDKYEDGISVEDSKILGLTSTINMRSGSPPTFFTVSFKMWDKKGEGKIEGYYKLYSK